jgi:hypothetical protein
MMRASPGDNEKDETKDYADVIYTDFFGFFLSSHLLIFSPRVPSRFTVTSRLIFLAAACRDG